MERQAPIDFAAQKPGAARGLSRPIKASTEDMRPLEGLPRGLQGVTTPFDHLGNIDPSPECKVWLPSSIPG